jgi:hypothetical protein
MYADAKHKSGLPPNTLVASQAACSLACEHGQVYEKSATSHTRSTLLRERDTPVRFLALYCLIRPLMSRKRKGHIMPDSPSCEFRDQLTDFLPKMRGWAMALTRNSAAAEDLVQDVAMKACRERVFRRRHEFLGLGAPDNDQSLHFRRAKSARVQ